MAPASTSAEDGAVGHQPKSSNQRRRYSKERRSDAQYRALLDALEELLQTEEPRGITVQAITRKASLDRTSFYFYFTSKEDALGELVSYYMRKIYEAAEPLFDENYPISESLRKAIENQVEVWGRHGRALATISDLAGTNLRLREQWFSEVEQFVEPMHQRILALDRKLGRPHPPQSRMRAELFVWTHERFYYLWASGRYKWTADEVAQGLYGPLMSMLGLEVE
ncbi:TetR/AcrR family transcriptional regulator [Nocardia xishanensis]|uniref:TetR/AcrR family transcriptional regulator n=1 Tax=Nocardia xishanensis TaxID=238964 RepID=A0ABW7XBP8_9NOCA